MTRQLEKSGFEPDTDAGLARVQIVFTPDPKPDLPEDEYYATEQGFTLEFVLDPTEDIDPAINALLAGDATLESSGLFGVDLSTAASLTVARESGAPLDSWLSFDPATLSFTGTPPSYYVGAVPVRIDVEAGAGVPEMSIITEVVVDETFTIDPDDSGGIIVNDLPERINLVTPGDYNGSFAFTYDANDEKGGESEEPAIIVFNALAQRELPVAFADTVDLFENGSVTFDIADLLINDRDDDGDALEITEIGMSDNGLIEADLAAGTITYTPNMSFAGLDTVSYTLSDGSEGTVQGAIIFDVASLLDPPIAETDQVSVDEDSFVIIDPATLLANDSDVDGDPFRFLSVQDAVNGTVQFDGTDITFTPIPDFDGRASFTYTITDDRHGESTGLVNVNVDSTNRAPEAVTDVFATIEDTPFEFTIDDLLANDTDLDGDAISFLSIQTSIEDARILELPDGRYQFVPDENINGQRSFDYAISDGRLTSRGTITFDIEAVNDGPIANQDGPFYGDQDTPFAISFADLLFNDRDVEGDSFSIVEIFDGDNGTVFQDGDTAVFQGRDGYFGDGGFKYRVTDEFGATTIGYATVLVFPLFDVPVAVSDAGFEMLEDTFIDIDPAELMANDQIPLGSEVMFLGLTGGTNANVEELDNGMYRVTAAQDFFGEITLRYALTNETGFEVPTTVTINVLPVADGPVAVDDTFNIMENEELVIFTTALTDNDFDVDRQAIQLTRILETDGLTVEDLGNGQLIITPDLNFAGAATFSYELKDSSGAATTGNVTVNVESVNNAPEIAEIPVLEGVEDVFFTANLPSDAITDADGDVLLVELRGPGGTALPDWLDFDAETRAVSGLPPQDFNGDIVLELAVTDGRIETTQEVTIRIAPVNDAPEVSDIITAAFNEDNMVLTIDLLANASDVDGDDLDVANVALTAPTDRVINFTVDDETGMLTLTAGEYEDLPALDELDIDFSFDVTDGMAMPVSTSASVTITGQNDAPEITTTGFEAPENGLAVGTVEATDVDRGDVVTFVITGGEDAALFDIDLNSGVLSFRAAQDFEMPGSADGDPLYVVEITANDGALTETQEISVTLTDVTMLDAIATAEAESFDSEGAMDRVSYADSDGGILLTMDGSPGFGGFAAGDQLLGIETVTGSSFGDLITGDMSANSIDGANGNDTINGGMGDDTLSGGANNDIFVVEADAGTDTITDFTVGQDVIDVRAVGAVFDTLTIAADPSGTRITHPGGEIILLGITPTDLSEDDFLLAPNAPAPTITATNSDDTLFELEGPLVLEGLGGDDRLRVISGDATLVGGTDDDRYWVYEEDTVITENPGEGYDLAYVYTNYVLPDHVESATLQGIEDLSLAAGSTGAWLNGNAGNNTLTGGIGEDRLDGNAGDDTLDGGEGDDVLEGGIGRDVFVIGLDAGEDIALDFNLGEDLIDITALGVQFDNLSIESHALGAVVVHRDGELVLQGVDPTALDADDFIVSIGAPAPSVTIAGTENADTLFERQGPLVLEGLDGADRLRVQAGDATLVGGGGDDRYWVYESTTVVTELADEGYDTIYAYADFALPDNVEVIRAASQTSIDLTGSDSDNWLQGNAADNTLDGGAGNDRIQGRAGADRIIGGTGSDLLDGNADADVFVFATGDGIDTIRDFEIGIDSLDLTATGLAFGDLVIEQTNRHGSLSCCAMFGS
ncbi:MAG: tandem-95 repeat protein, partial [Pseudomonadota bacterium]